MNIEITILGCGSSSGVPAIGNDWGNCNPSNPKNRRLRSSILIKTSKKNILIDATPDLRQQLLNSNVKHIDGVLITHCHADHINGIDDFRFLNVIMKQDINLYATKQVIRTIKERFSYVFEKLSPKANGFYYKPCLIPNEIVNKFSIDDVEISCFQQSHGFSETTGFKINNFAYCTDVVEFDTDVFDKLRDLDLWIVDCFRFEPHKSHAHFDKVMTWVEKLKPRKVVLTHMNNEMDYEHLTTMLPRNCFPAYDGLTIKI